MENVNAIKIQLHTLKLAIPGTSMGISDRPYLQRILKDADGVILPTLGCHVSFSSLLKIKIENMRVPSAMKRSPVELLGVVIGNIGVVHIFV